MDFKSNHTNKMACLQMVNGIHKKRTVGATFNSPLSFRSLFCFSPDIRQKHRGAHLKFLLRLHTLPHIQLLRA